jgi:hypothetical protein
VNEGEANLQKWADWAHAQGKPFFLTEYGNMQLGWGGDDPNPKSFDSNASDVICVLVLMHATDGALPTAVISMDSGS